LVENRNFFPLSFHSAPSTAVTLFEFVEVFLQILVAVSFTDLTVKVS